MTKIMKGTLRRRIAESGVMIAVLCFLLGCAARTRHLKAVEPFDLSRYAGTWYEIARLPHGFEKNLQAVTAIYILEKGKNTIGVVNRGYDTRKKRWRSIQGKAVQPEPGVGTLRVTFFWPFYGSYKIIELDRRDYSYSMVTSHSFGYLWILARSPQMEPSLLTTLVEKAESWGFATDELIFVDHSPEGAP